MITVYSIVNNQVARKSLTHANDLTPQAVWIDVMNPGEAEKRMLHDILNVNIKSRQAVDQLEVKNSFYREDDAYYMTVTVLSLDKANRVEGAPLTFIVKNDYLITLRYAQPVFFAKCEAKLMRAAELCSQPDLIFEELVGFSVNTIAEMLEMTGNELDSLLNSVFEDPISTGVKQQRHSANHYGEIIKKIGHIGNVVSKNRESLMSLSRLLIFYNHIKSPINMAQKEHRICLNNMAREIQSLGEYASFISQRHGFLLDATLGLLGVEQNTIIKVFTVAAAAFMPPTMIASVYGMNFGNMPELQWEYGYEMVMMAIVISAVLPYIYFKIKRWL